MERLDPVKIHKSHGCYERLVAMAEDEHRHHHVESFEEGLRKVIAKHRDLAELVLYGPKDPQWRHIPLIKQIMGVRDREAISRENVNLALRLNPTFARQVARGDFQVPASALIEKRGGVPIRKGLTAYEALMEVAKRHEAEGMPLVEAMNQAAHEHPDWYEQHTRQALGR